MGISEQAIRVTSLCLVILTFISFHRAIIGPGPADRLVAVNVIGTKTAVLVALFAFIYEAHHFLDVCIVYALLSFITTCGVARFIDRGNLVWERETNQ